MSFDLTEKRYIKETGLEARISAIVEPVANDLGYSLVRIKVTQENGCTLQIMAEDANGHFAITDCERLSKDLSPVLDVEDPIDREYHLEVSSPGIDRPLVRARDFIRYIGHEARVELIDLMDGRKRFRGPIVAADEDTFTIRLPEAPKDTDPNFRLPLANLAEAKLIMTDALMDMARTAQESENPLDNPELETEADDDDFDNDLEALNDEDEIDDLEDLDGIEDDDGDKIVKN
ncbi:MAG: RimP [Hyphomicrobiales bacterium]|nr:RimP [Hyphomicrobiales bacterium]